MRFSIVIPAFNASARIANCFESVRRQTFPAAEVEVLCVDDASTDSTPDVAREAGKRLNRFRLILSPRKGGPGAARNLGISAACGGWLLFLDADDELMPHALSVIDRLSRERPELDLIAFDWTYQTLRPELKSSARSGRRDGGYFASRDILIERYLQHRMDGSSIFNAYRRDLFADSRLRFAEGLHEDVDFAFRAYAQSCRQTYEPSVLYLKDNHAGSIVNQISERHLDGYIRAWSAIGDDVKSQPNLGSRDLREAYRWGTVGAVATRVREIVRHESDARRRAALFAHLYKAAQSKFDTLDLGLASNSAKTTYHMIAAQFLSVMANATLELPHGEAQITNFVEGLAGKSWSCQDLHHSIFLAPDQVRTCCKRFFVGGEIRGDVALFDVPKEPSRAIEPEQILKAKQALHQAINSGEPTGCDGCPFLEFKDWSPLNRLDLTYLSMEHHSICNMRCTYCSDTYFGGAQPNYDVSGTVDRLVAEGALERCSIVVWGGGDPVAAKNFGPLLKKVAAGATSARQRVLTNAVKYSAVLEDMLVDGRAHVVTSVDAGTEATFQAVRGVAGLDRVLGHIARYSKAGQVSIKYIFTSDNASDHDVRGFVALLAAHKLLGCDVQISSDFKQEFIAREAALAMTTMYALLRRAGCESVIFDELLRARLTRVLAEEGDALVAAAHRAVGFEFIASPATLPRVVIWGAGQQARYLVRETLFFKTAAVKHFVDSTPSKIGTMYLGCEVKDPVVLRDSEDPVLIAAVQGYPLVLEQFNRLGLEPKRLIRDLVI
ncbi:MAG: glycosyltransferase [Alphaproteobacteria bacterium]|nr:glycosyltransferase [Alphaproteobacteria bacterium]